MYNTNRLSTIQKLVYNKQRIPTIQESVNGTKSSVCNTIICLRYKIVFRQHKTLSTVQNRVSTVRQLVYNTKTYPQYKNLSTMQSRLSTVREFVCRTKSSVYHTIICLQYATVFLQYKNLSTVHNRHPAIQVFGYSTESSLYNTRN